MIGTSVIQCFSSGLAKNKIIFMFVLFSQLLAILKGCPFFENRGTNLTSKQSNRIFLVNLSKVQQPSNNSSNKIYFHQKLKTNLTEEDTYRRLFKRKALYWWKKLWLFGLFSGGKGDYIDVWMITIMIKANSIDMYPMYASFKSRQDAQLGIESVGDIGKDSNDNRSK